MTKAKQIKKATKATAIVAVQSNDYLAQMLVAFDSRAAYEAAKNADNSNMQKTLADLKKSINHELIASVMSAANVSADFINRSERNNARFNVYSAEKIVNVARSLKSAASLNHYTKAITASIAAYAKAKLDFTHKDAIAACSSDSKVDKNRDVVLKRYQKIVSATTQTTQASSSLNALLQYHVISEYRDTTNNVCYRMNDNDVAQDVLALCA
jgi:Xaa-Pro aminopeptidase